MGNTEIDMHDTLAEEPRGRGEDETAAKRAEIKKYHQEQLVRLKAGEITEEEYLNDTTERELNLDALADYDSLTGLLNRRGLMTRFHEKLLNFRRDLGPDSEVYPPPSVTPGPILMIDLDDFKAANDEAGGGSHDFGDLILGEIAKTLVISLRPEDLVSRWGGDEVVIFLEGETEEMGLRVANRLAWQISQRTENETGYKQTVSIGLAMLPQLDRDKLAELEYRETIFKQTLEISDIASYNTKTQGKNGVSYPLPGGNFNYIPAYDPAGKK